MLALGPAVVPASLCCRHAWCHFPLCVLGVTDAELGHVGRDSESHIAAYGCPLIGDRGDQERDPRGGRRLYRDPSAESEDLASQIACLGAVADGGSASFCCHSCRRWLLIVRAETMDAKMGRGQQHMMEMTVYQYV